MQLHINILFATTTTIVFLFSLLFPIISQAQLFPMENDIQDGNDDNLKDVKNNDPINVKDKNKQEEDESEPTLPKPTLSDEIELAGKVNHVVDGDTLDINDIRICLSLVDTPERGDSGFKEAT